MNILKVKFWNTIPIWMNFLLLQNLGLIDLFFSLSWMKSGHVSYLAEVMNFSFWVDLTKLDVAWNHFKLEFPPEVLNPNLYLSNHCFLLVLLGCSPKYFCYVTCVDPVHVNISVQHAKTMYHFWTINSFIHKPTIYSETHYVIQKRTTYFVMNKLHHF